MPKKVLPGASQMRAFVAELPDALLQGFHLGREIALPAETGPASVLVVGMGGSGIGAELARGVVEAETSVSVSVVRAPQMPKGVGSRSRVFLVSYSGNTWETLSSFDAAGRAGAYRVAITSGGELAERAAGQRIPLLPLPSGLPPRAAVGYLLGGVLGLLDPWFPESNEERIRRCADRLRGRIAAFGRARGPADRLATAIGPRLPFFYAESAFLGLARRWRTQVEENAKRIAVFDEIPELLHNAIVGWDATSRAEARARAVILFEWSGTSPTIRQSIRYLEKLLRSKGVGVERVALAPEDRLEALLEGLALGDLVSLFLAEKAGVDPLPVDALSRAKTALRGSTAATPEARPGRLDSRS